MLLGNSLILSDRTKEENIQYLKGKKLIFLDIDGVLNSEHFDCGVYQEIEKGSNEKNYRQRSMCPNLINNLNMITDETDALIVISSHWRHCEDTLEEVIAFFDTTEITGNIIGRTPYICFDDRCNVNSTVFRGTEIYYFKDFFDFKGKYCILDDDGDMMLYQKDSFFHLNDEYGLTYSRSLEIIKHLNGC